MSVLNFARLQNRRDVLIVAMGTQGMNRFRAAMDFVEPIHYRANGECMKTVTGLVHYLFFQGFKFSFERVFAARNRMIEALQRHSAN